jgi:hypothetical protein
VLIRSRIAASRSDVAIQVKNVVGVDLSLQSLNQPGSKIVQCGEPSSSPSRFGLVEVRTAAPLMLRSRALLISDRPRLVSLTLPPQRLDRLNARRAAARHGAPE